MGSEDEHLAAFAPRAQPPRRGVRRRHGLRRSGGGNHPPGRRGGAVLDGSGTRRRGGSAAAGRGGERRPGRPRRRRLPGMEGRTGGAAGRRSGHAGLLGGGGRGQRERQGALGGDDRERVLGLRGQRVGGRSERVRGVPDGARPPAGTFGLSLPHRTGDRLTRTSGCAAAPAWPWGWCSGR